MTSTAAIATDFARPGAPAAARSVSALELFFIVYVSFGLGWFFNNFVSFNVGKYLFSGYAQLFLLTCWWGLLVLRKETVRPRTIAVLAVLAAIVAIESYHVWRVGVGRGDVTGVKAILYSPLYMPLINLVMLGLIINEYQARRMQVIKAIVAVAVWLNVLGIAMWTLAFTGLVLPIETDSSALEQVLNNNTAAYVSCFVFYCVHFTSLREQLLPRERTFYTLVSLVSIFLYTSRGAALVIAAYAVLMVLRRLSRARIAIGTVAAVAVAAAIMIVARTDTAGLYYRVFSTLSDYMDRMRDVTGPIVQFQDFELADLTRERPTDSLVSAVGRIFSGLIALQTFRDNAGFGVGTYTAYSIEAYGAGIHSLPILYAASAGIVGMLLLALLFWLMGRGRRVLPSHVLYLLPVGLFLNMFPLWYACCFFLEYVPGRPRPRRTPNGRQPAGATG